MIERKKNTKKTQKNKQQHLYKEIKQKGQRNIRVQGPPWDLPYGILLLSWSRLYSRLVMPACLVLLAACESFSTIFHTNRQNQGTKFTKFQENLDLLGEVLLQDRFTVWDPKQLIKKGRDRHIFLFEMCLLVAKEVKDSNGKSKYVYKFKLMVGLSFVSRAVKLNANVPCFLFLSPPAPIGEIFRASMRMLCDLDLDCYTIIYKYIHIGTRMLPSIWHVT